jgi:tRNA(His) 5'-end guanylyltransferase
MSKIFKLIEDLTVCYQLKAPYTEDYLKLVASGQADVCKDVRLSLVNYVNSDEYNFYDIAKNIYDDVSGKFKILKNLFIFKYLANELYPHNQNKLTDIENKGMQDYGKL